MSTEREPEPTRSQHNGVVKPLMFAGTFVLSSCFLFTAWHSDETPSYISAQPPPKIGDAYLPKDVQISALEEHPRSSGQDPVEHDQMGSHMSLASGEPQMEEEEKGVISLTPSDPNVTSDGKEHENEDGGSDAGGDAGHGDESSDQREDMKNLDGVIIPTKKNVNQLSREQISQILNKPAGLHGFQDKAGMLDPFQWMAARKEERWSMVRDWLIKAVSFDNDKGPVQPPVNWPGCHVVVNHHYKFVWIRGFKVGGTTMTNNLGFTCAENWKLPKDADMSYCGSLESINPNITEAEARKWWSEYFVFTVVRNPFSRFASGYAYLEQANKGCLSTFAEICQDPFLLAKKCKIADCCFPGARDNHMRHIMEQSPCLFNEDGQLSVDFIGRTETLAQDFQTIANEVNSRRLEGVPELDAAAVFNAHVNSHPSSKEDYGSVLFKENPQCLLEVQKNFANDLAGLEFELL